MIEKDQNDEKRKEISLKLVLIGDTGVGKTSILTQFCDNKFDKNVVTTSGIEFKTKTICKNGFNIKMQIWDTSGEERFRSITPNYFHSSDGLLFVFDITNEESLKTIDYFMKFSDNCSKKNKLIKIIIGNKRDQKERKINQDKIDEFLKKYNFDKYFEASAMYGDHINEIFDLIADLFTKEGNLEETMVADKTIENDNGPLILQKDSENKPNKKKEENNKCFC